MQAARPPALHRYAPCQLRRRRGAGWPGAARWRAGHRPPAACSPAATALLADGWPVLAALAACGAAAQWADRHTRWGAALSAPMLSMSAAIALAAGGVLPLDCKTYAAVWTYIMPAAAALFMLESDVSQLATNGGHVLAAFLLGAAGMLAGALAAWQLMGGHMGQEGGKLAACLCASYVGGSVNFAAVAAATGLAPGAVPGAMAADNLAMAGLLAALAAAPVRQAAGASAGASAAGGAGGSGSVGQQADPSQAAAAAGAPLTAESAALSLAAAALAAASGRALAQHWGAGSMHLLVMALLALCISLAGNGAARAAAARRPGGGAAPLHLPSSPFAGASALATALMGLYFATIGASAGALSSLATSAPLVGFVCLMTGVHWALLAGAGRALRLPGPALLVGSNACVGGPATAAGMAASRGWPQLAQPAMLCGSLGYALGTGAGLAVARAAGVL